MQKTSKGKRFWLPSNSEFTLQHCFPKISGFLHSFAFFFTSRAKPSCLHIGYLNTRGYIVKCLGRDNKKQNINCI